MAGTESTTIEASQPVINIADVIKQVRDQKCNARLFDARVRWIEVPVRDAWLVVRCWRCKRLIGYRPILEAPEVQV